MSRPAPPKQITTATTGTTPIRSGRRTAASIAFVSDRTGKEFDEEPQHRRLGDRRQRRRVDEDLDHESGRQLAALVARRPVASRSSARHRRTSAPADLDRAVRRRRIAPRGRRPRSDSDRPSVGGGRPGALLRDRVSRARASCFASTWHAKRARPGHDRRAHGARASTSTNRRTGSCISRNDSTHLDDVYVADLTGATEKQLTHVNAALWKQLSLVAGRAHAVQGRRRLGRRRFPGEAARLAERQEVSDGAERFTAGRPGSTASTGSTSSRSTRRTAGRCSSRTRADRPATARSSSAASR